MPSSPGPAVSPRTSGADSDAALTFGLSRDAGARPSGRRKKAHPTAVRTAETERVRAQPTQLSKDRFRGLGAQEGTAVEPDSFSSGSTVVAAYQVGRFIDGGALAIGFSTTKNAGKTWRSGLLPSLSRAAKPSGEAEFVADPSVAFDAKHGYWMIASLAALPTADTVLISRARNGLAWQAPITAVRSEGLDKSWIACDNWSSSPNRGSCYLTFLDASIGAILMRTSKDGGATWSRSVVAFSGRSANLSVNGAQPLIRPNGTVIVAFTALADVPSPGRHHISVVRSTDGGATFGSQQDVGFIEGQSFFILGVRAPQFVSGDVDSGGTVYLTWHDCPAYECAGNEIVFSRSADGLGWSTPRPLPAAVGRKGDDAFLPGLAVEPGTRGVKARLAVAYYSMRCSGVTICELDAFLTTSPDGGRTWKMPERLNPKTMKLHWLADTNFGRMVGDYISTSFAAGRPVPVLALAGAPSGGRFNEAIFASSTRR